MNITASCTACGKEIEIEIPDDHADIQVAWECPGTVPTGRNAEGEPYDVACATKNFTAGVTPVEMALEAVGFGQNVREGVVEVHDEDASSSEDAQVVG